VVVLNYNVTFGPSCVFGLEIAVIGSHKIVRFVQISNKSTRFKITNSSLGKRERKKDSTVFVVKAYMYGDITKIIIRRNFHGGDDDNDDFTPNLFLHGTFCVVLSYPFLEGPKYTIYLPLI
jgi:hypothetical protein